MLPRLLLLAALTMGLAVPATAGQRQETGASGRSGPAVDVGRLPVNVSRIGRQLRQSESREERDGLRLRYTVDVYGYAPRIEIIAPQDNIRTGSVPHSAPTHFEMLQMMTPPEFRGGLLTLGSVPIGRRK